MKTIGLTKLVEELNLKNLTPDVDMEDVEIVTPDINRPALQLTGYYEHFPNERVQIIGMWSFPICSICRERRESRRLTALCPGKFPV